MDAADGEAGLRWHQVIDEPDPQAPGVCLLGFASDIGVARNQGRVGAAEGPASLRRAMGVLPALPDRALYDAGDVVAGKHLEAAQSAYGEELARQLEAGHFVLGLGGGHDIAWGAWQGLEQFLSASGKHTGARVGIVNFDAHFDLRDATAGATSGTPFRQIADRCERDGRDFRYLCLGVSEAANTRALFEAADACGARYLRDVDCVPEAAFAMLGDFVAALDFVYVTVCLDALPAAVAPGVSAPAALGIAPTLVIRCLGEIRRLCRRGSCQWLLADIAELCPRHDEGGRTARVAARLAWEICR